MEYKAVFADVDGTLIPAGAHPITRASEKVLRTVARIQEKGILFSLASARSFKWVSGLIESLHLKAPLICDNGSRIYDTRIGKYILENYIDEKKVEEIISCVKKMNFILHMVDMFKGKERRFVYDRNNPIPLGKVVKTMILQISARDAQYLFESLSQISDIQVTKSISSHNPIQESVHTTCAKGSKAYALEWILKKESLKKEEVIGIGDSYNDKELLEACGLKVAMGNSVPEILKIADYIAPSYEDDGVADVLEKYILNI